MKLLWKDREFLFGFFILCVIITIAVFGPFLMALSPTSQDYSNLYASFSYDHWAGTDGLGRDLFTRFIYGARVELYACFLAILIGFIFGVPFGALAGFLGGPVDTIISRIIDSLLAFPAIVLAIAVVGVLGIGLTNAMIAIGIIMAPEIARLTRAQALITRKSLYVEASRGFGASSYRILFKHVLPNSLQPVLTQLMILAAIALLAEASLSFLGLGVQSPTVSWGLMLADAYENIEFSPTMIYLPGIGITLTAWALYSIGDSLRRTYDPMLKNTHG